MTNYTQWKSLVDLHEYSAIPDVGDLHTHLEASDISDISEAWEDKQGRNDYDPINAPSLDDINGEAAVLYDGSEEANAVSEWDETIEQPYTIISVWQFLTIDDGNINAVYSFGETNGPELTESDGEFRIWAGANLSADFDADTEPHISGAVYDGTESIFDLDGDEVATGDSGDGDDYDITASDIAEIGRTEDQNRHTNIKVGAKIVFRNKLDSSERQEWYNYLSDLFNINVD